MGKQQANFQWDWLLSKLTVLTKPYWFASDIQIYLNCSLSRANRLKQVVENKYGVITEHEDREFQAVKADDVIKAIGGKSRLEEIEILQKSVEILKSNER